MSALDKISNIPNAQTLASVVSISNICKEFSGENGRKVKALHNVTLESRKGEFLSILGPTGCGKTTLLRLIAGLESQDSGEVRIKGLFPDENRNEVGFVFQQNALFPWRNILDNVMFGLEARNWDTHKATQRAMECLELVGMADVSKAFPYELSGGMQQRAAIARGLAPSPMLLLMDEPFGALDEKTRKVLQDKLLSLWAETGINVVFVTHNIEEAIYLAQRVVILDIDPGRIAKEKVIELPYPRNRLGKDFIQDLLEVRESFEKIVS